MASQVQPYDYVQIVVDDDWGLLGIVPPGGAGERMKKMSIPPVKPLHESRSEKKSNDQTNTTVSFNNPSNQKDIKSGNNIPNKVAEATVINVPSAGTRRKPVTRIITKPESVASLPPQITPAEIPRDSITLSDVNKSSKSNPNVISGMFDYNYLSGKQDDNTESRSKLVYNQVIMDDSDKQIFTSSYDKMPETFGNISSLAVVRGKDNILIGFGK